MNHELNRTIKLNDDSEFSPLYSWSLEEFDSEDNKVEEGFIPMQIGSVYLSVERLVYYNSIEGSKYGQESSGFQESEHIQGELKTLKQHSQLRQPTSNTFSMFGTDREIKDFAISIYKTDNGDTGKGMSFSGKKIDSKKENAYFSASIGWQDDEDLDLPAHSAEDSLFINVFLKEEKFNKILKYINDGVNAKFMRIGHTDGFYNKWTPSIHLEDIKILSDDKSFEKDEPYLQQVEIPKECDITPPRLGRLYDFNIHFSIESNISVDDNNENEDEDDYKDDYETDNPVELESSTDVISYQLSQISDLGLKLSKSSLVALRLPLWIIAITLLLILVFK
jgi:hypothetical protein